MAKFKLKKPKIPKKPKVKNPMKGVHRARAMFVTMLAGTVAFVMSFYLIYRQFEREGEGISRFFNKGKSRSAQTGSTTGNSSSSNIPSDPNSRNGEAGSLSLSDNASADPKRVAHSGQSVTAENAASASRSRGGVADSGSQSATVPDQEPYIESPRIKPSFVDPVCFWFEKGRLKFKSNNRKDIKEAKQYFEKAISYAYDGSNQTCLTNARSFLETLKREGI